MFECLSSSGVVAAALIAPPGAEVIAALSLVPVSGLSPGGEVDLLIAWERQAAWISAVTQTVMARVGDLTEAAAVDCMIPRDPSDLALRAAHAEIGAALRLSDVTASNRLETARVLTRRLPMVHAALAAGDISYWHASAIVDSTRMLDESKAAVAARILPRARKQTVSDLRRCLRRAVLAIDPASASERAARAKAERSLDWRPLDDGMAELRVTAPAADIIRLFNSVDARAHILPKVGTDGAFLPIDARRVDALIDLVTRGPGRSDEAGGSHPARRKPAVAAQVTIDLPTLLGLRDNPGELSGYGPIPAEAARALAADARWRRLIHDPLTGALLDLGRTSYEPSAELSRFVRTRNRHCSFPGCYQPAYRCELDHTKPFKPGCCDGGGTDRANLGPLCKSHHRIKHEAGWTMKRDPDTGQVTWKSLLGHRYFTEPVRYGEDFEPDEPPLPEGIRRRLDDEARLYEKPTANPLSPAKADPCPF